MNSWPFLWGNSFADIWQHGSRLVVGICLIVILRKTSIVSKNVGISPTTVRFILHSNVSVEKLSAIQLSHCASKSPCKGLGATLYLRTIEWQHFIYIKFKCLKCNHFIIYFSSIIKTWNKAKLSRISYWTRIRP